MKKMVTGIIPGIHHRGHTSTGMCVCVCVNSRIYYDGPIKYFATNDDGDNVPCTIIILSCAIHNAYFFIYTNNCVVSHYHYILCTRKRMVEHQKKFFFLLQK